MLAVSYIMKKLKCLQLQLLFFPSFVPLFRWFLYPFCILSNAPVCSSASHLYFWENVNSTYTFKGNLQFKLWNESFCCLLNEGFVGLVIAFLHYNSYTTHFNYTTLWFLEYSQGCTTFTTINFRPFPSPQEEILCFSAITPHFPHLL